MPEYFEKFGTADMPEWTRKIKLPPGWKIVFNWIPITGYSGRGLMFRLEPVISPVQGMLPENILGSYDTTFQGQVDEMIEMVKARLLRGMGDMSGAIFDYMMEEEMNRQAAQEPDDSQEREV